MCRSYSEDRPTPVLHCGVGDGQNNGSNHDPGGESLGCQACVSVGSEVVQPRAAPSLCDLGQGQPPAMGPSGKQLMVQRGSTLIIIGPNPSSTLFTNVRLLEKPIAMFSGGYKVHCLLLPVVAQTRKLNKVFLSYDTSVNPLSN